MEQFGLLLSTLQKVNPVKIDELLQLLALLDESEHNYEDPLIQ